MTIEDIEAICDALPAITKDIKWEEHLCFNVAGKMFLITSPDVFPPDAAFKVTAEEFNELIAQDGFIPAPHLGRYNWVKVTDIGLLNKNQWEYYIRQSYNLIVARLPAKIKSDLGVVNYQ